MIHVTGERDGGDIRLVVEDNGAGMDAERLEKVRGALSHEQRIGFGVATVHERLQLLFGMEYGLQIESSPGEGTRVTVRIPARAESTRNAL